MMGVYEYCGIQRTGKSTLMVADMLRLLREYEPCDVYCNFAVFVEGVNCLCNWGLLDAIMRMKREKLRHKIIMVDEAGQVWPGRGYTDRKQTEAVAFSWQMPKRDILMLYSSNVGSSVDVILRDATWQTVMPRYRKGMRREDDEIMADVIYNYDCRIMRNVRITGFQAAQDCFDSWQAIE